MEKEKAAVDMIQGTDLATCLPFPESYLLIYTEFHYVTQAGLKFVILCLSLCAKISNIYYHIQPKSSMLRKGTRGTLRIVYRLPEGSRE